MINLFSHRYHFYFYLYFSFTGLQFVIGSLLLKALLTYLGYLLTFAELYAHLLH